MTWKIEIDSDDCKHRWSAPDGFCGLKGKYVETNIKYLPDNYKRYTLQWESIDNSECTPENCPLRIVKDSGDLVQIPAAKHLEMQKMDKKDPKWIKFCEYLRSEEFEKDEAELNKIITELDKKRKVDPMTLLTPIGGRQ